MLVDYEKVVLLLKAYVSAKPNHGQRDLLAEISALEGANQLEEGLPEKALRLYGVVLTDSLTRPNLPRDRVPEGDGSDDNSSRREEDYPSEEDNDGSREAGEGAGAVDRGAARSAGRQPSACA